MAPKRTRSTRSSAAAAAAAAAATTATSITPTAEPEATPQGQDTDVVMESTSQDTVAEPSASVGHPGTKNTEAVPAAGDATITSSSTNDPNGSTPASGSDSSTAVAPNASAHKNTTLANTAEDPETCPACTPMDRPTSRRETWIECENCNTWYHWRCVGKTNGSLEDMDTIAKWYCTKCFTEDPSRVTTYKTAARKSQRKRPIRDYASLNNAGLTSDPLRFSRILETKAVKKAQFARMKGSDLERWLEEDEGAMKEPIIIEKTDGLGMKMPRKDLTVEDVAEMVGEDTPVEVIDVATQSNLSGWNLGKWADYVDVEPSKRDKILNVISLEISGTPLANDILPPKIVRDLDWVENFWPGTRKGKGQAYPKVQLYCLMGVANAWTDWHVDFAGSSVYYHILHGAKVFYFIKPTPSNLAAYERWSGSELQYQAWLGDMVDEVTKVELVEGNTMIIPSGWIHAVFTPMDTLVFGGNFVHSYDVAMQLKIRSIENATQVPKRFRFPMFTKLCWYVGDKYLRDIKSGNASSLHPRVLDGIVDLAEFLVTEARVIEGGSDTAKREAREQVPSDRVKDAPAVARELRWRAKQLTGYDSEEETPRKPAKRRKVEEEVTVVFRHFEPRAWERVETRQTQMETKKTRRRRPGGEWAQEWAELEDKSSGSEAEVESTVDEMVRVRGTATGIERQIVRKRHEKWRWGVNPSGVDIAPKRTDEPPTYLDAFDALTIDDNVQPNRSASLSPYPHDQHRAPSPMSMRTAHSAQGPQHPPRHAQSLPPQNMYHHHYNHYPSPQDNYYPPNAYYPPQQQPPPPQQQQQQYHPHPQQQAYTQHPPHQQHWQPPPPPPQPQYNQYHTAASDVLGMGPPPTQPPAFRPPPPSVHSSDRSIYAGSITSGHSGTSAASIHFPGDQSTDFEPRPAYQRSGTSASLAPSSVKGKAIDLKSPPYTKEYIDQYRLRIKGDPDPEAHFLYAKYLIDAAKHIRTAFKDKDERAAKKYSELLITESLKVMRRLATQGETYPEAQFFLANCYGTGALGLQVDHERAYHLYLQAAKSNHAAACYRVAVCNDIGAGTKKEPQRAATFYRKAASLGDTPAMFKVGLILLYGQLEQPRNPKDAVSWLKHAAEQADEENPHALHELASLYEQKSDQPVPYDPGYAKVLYTQAAQLGFTKSQYKLGQCYEYGTLTCPVDPKRSIAWYTKAAEKNYPDAELALSGWYLTGSEGVLKQSDEEAYLWARRAATKCLAKAEYAVGYYTEVGIGTKQDLEGAKRWYMHAAAQGHAGAMNRLTELKNRGAARRQMGRPTRQQANEECIIC